MGMKEKEHVVYFWLKIKDSRVLPSFERFLTGAETKSATVLIRIKSTLKKNQVSALKNKSRDDFISASNENN